MAHTIKAKATEPVFFRTPFGETKIPDPIMLPAKTMEIKSLKSH